MTHDKHKDTSVSISLYTFFCFQEAYTIGLSLELELAIRNTLAFGAGK